MWKRLMLMNVAVTPSMEEALKTFAVTVQMKIGTMTFMVTEKKQEMSSVLYHPGCIHHVTPIGHPTFPERMMIRNTTSYT